MEHKGTSILETPRLILRPFTADDGDAMFRNWANDAEVTRYLTWQPHESAEVSRQLAARWEKESKQPEIYQWAIVPKELGEPIGSISAVHIDEDLRTAEIGYCIGQRWWGHGLMPEALRRVIRYLIRDVGLNGIFARHDVENTKSGRVMQKAGMHKDGILRASGRNRRGIVDMVWYSVLAEELDEQPSDVFRPMARKKQALSQEECIEILCQEKRGILSVQGDNGYPYGIPLNHWYCPEDGKLYFHSGSTGHKIDAMTRDYHASYCVLDAGTPMEEIDWALRFRSVIVFGKLEPVTDHESALAISRQISYKFTRDEDYIEDEVCRAGNRVLCFSLTPEHISGKLVSEK